MRLILYFGLIMIAFLGSCDKSETLQKENDTPYMKLSSHDKYEQDIANDIKVKLNKREEISIIHVVNDKENIVIAFDLDHHHRFSLGKIEQEIINEFEKSYQNYQLTVSTDQKIISELQKLEKSIHEKTTSKKKISQQLKKIISLTKDEA